ncbi:MAG: GAF domain-containing protein, partial [Nitrospinota bacterium]
MRLERQLANLIALVSNVTEAYTAALFLENKARSGYQLITYHSLSRHIIPNALILPGQGLVGWVLQNRQPLSVDQFRYETSSLGFYSQEEEIKSFMAAPILSARVDGALAIDSKKSYVFTPKVQKLLIGFSEQFANLLETAVEFSSVQRERVPVGALHSYLSSLSATRGLSSLCNAVCLIPRELLSFDGCFLVLKSEDGKRFHLVRTGGLGELFLQGRVVAEKGSLTGWIVSNERPLRLNDVRGASRKTFLFHPEEPVINFRSFLGVPLSWDGTVFGALGFCAARPLSFDEADQQRAELLALQVSQALSRAFIARRWENLAMVDPVTGTHNFRHSKRELRLAVERTLERGGSLSILAVGIDKLPQLN